MKAGIRNAAGGTTSLLLERHARPHTVSERIDPTPLHPAATVHTLERIPGATAGLLHVESGIAFLERWDALQATRTMKYDDDPANVSVRYENGSNCYVSVFVFPARLLATRKAFEQAHRAGTFDMMRTITAVEAVDDRDIGFARAGMRPVLGRRTEVVGPLARAEEQRPMVLLSSFWLYAETHWAVKFRATCSPPKGPLVRTFVAAWLDASGVGAERPRLPSR